MILPLALREEILAHAREEAPRECCGILGGAEGVTKVYRGVNSEPGLHRYSLEPLSQLAIIQELDADGLRMLGIYHSHVESPAYPSPTDVRLAYWPEAVYVIVSLATDEMRAFRIREGQVIEDELMSEGPADSPPSA